MSRATCTRATCMHHNQRRFSSPWSHPNASQRPTTTPLLSNWGQPMAKRTAALILLMFGVWYWTHASTNSHLTRMFVSTLQGACGRLSPLTSGIFHPEHRCRLYLPLWINNPRRGAEDHRLQVCWLNLVKWHGVSRCLSCGGNGTHPSTSEGGIFLVVLRRDIQLLPGRLCGAENCWGGGGVNGLSACCSVHTPRKGGGGLWTAFGQRRVDSKNSQTTPATTSTTSIRQLLGAADAQTAHHATFSKPQHTKYWAPRTRKRH